MLFRRSTVGVLAWLLPVLAVICFAVTIALSRSRWRAAGSVGRSLTWAAAVLGTVLVSGGFIVRRLDTDPLGGAVAQASWAVMVRPPKVPTL